MRNTALFLLLASGCAAPQPRVVPQNAVIAVSDERGAPIEEAAIVHDGKPVAKTAADGATEVRVAGYDGDIFPLHVECPSGFEPARPQELRLVVRRSERSATPRFDAQCSRSTRRITIEVKTSVAQKNATAASLPILYLGQEVGRTDTTGAARVEVEVRSGEDVELVLDTHEAKLRLHPAMPTLTVKAAEPQEAAIVEQAFTVEKPPSPRAVPRGPRGPRVIG